MSPECECCLSVQKQQQQQQQRSSKGPSVCSQVTNKSLSLSAPFVQELDELWQAGLSGSDAHGSPDQSTAMFDRDAERSPVVLVSGV